MEKGIYKEPVFEDGPYKGIARSAVQGDRWLVDLFLKRARQKDRPSRTGDKIREQYATRLEDPEDVSVYAEIMQNIKNKQSYRPEVTVKERDIPRLQTALDRFLKNTYVKNPIYAREVDANYLLTWLVKNMTNSDCEDPVSHVDRYADFVADETFDNMRTPVRLGRMDETVFYSYNTEEFEAGLETSNLFLFFAENGKETAMLPFLRYGIENSGENKTAYIYAIQRRKVPEGELSEGLKRVFAKANSGVKEHRDIQPSMLCVLASFTGMLNAKGIQDVKVPDFIVRRWGEFWDSTSEESDIAIQTSATNRFLNTFQRLTNQFEGIEVTAFPNDIDSFMHLTIAEDTHSNNEMLQTFYQMGRNATIERDAIQGDPDIMALVSEWQPLEPLALDGKTPVVEAPAEGIVIHEDNIEVAGVEKHEMFDMTKMIDKDLVE